MARNPSSRKKPRGAHEEDDAFIARTIEFSAWAKTNSQLLILAGVALLIGVAASVYYVSFRRSVEQQATTQLEAIQQTIALGDREGAKGQLTLYIDRFTGRYEIEARLILGQLHLETADAAQAIAILATV